MGIHTHKCTKSIIKYTKYIISSRILCVYIIYIYIYIGKSYKYKYKLKFIFDLECWEKIINE